MRIALDFVISIKYANKVKNMGVEKKDTAVVEVFRDEQFAYLDKTTEEFKSNRS